MQTVQLVGGKPAPAQEAAAGPQPALLGSLAPVLGLESLAEPRPGPLRAAPEIPLPH